MILVDKTIITNSEKQSNIFCSISSNVDKYSNTIKFTLDKINPYLCTHLLVDNNSSIFSPEIFDQFKIKNSNLKFILTFNIDENSDTDQWKEDLKIKKADGINIYINSNLFSNKIIDLIKVFTKKLFFFIFKFFVRRKSHRFYYQDKYLLYHFNYLQILLNKLHFLI